MFFLRSLIFYIHSDVNGLHIFSVPGTQRYTCAHIPPKVNYQFRYLNVDLWVMLIVMSSFSALKNIRENFSLQIILSA